MNENLRYCYESDGTIKLVQFDPFTQEALNPPDGVGPYQRNIQTPDGGVWNVSREELEKHFAMQRKEEMKEYSIDPEGRYAKNGCFLGIIPAIVYGMSSNNPVGAILHMAIFILIGGAMGCIYYRLLAHNAKIWNSGQSPPEPKVWQNYLSKIKDLEFPIPPQSQ